MWTDDQLRLLIDERKNKNTEYHNIPGSSRINFWNSIANTINERFKTNYTGLQCKNRFQNLVRDYNLMCQYIAGSKTGKRSRTGERYFEEFSSHFWERPETAFDVMHNANTSIRSRHRNRTPPPPTYRGMSPMLSRRESTADQRDRSASPTRRVPSRRGEVGSRDNTSNINIVEENLLLNSTRPNNNSTSGPTSNTPLSRIESDVIMPDAGASQELSNI